MDGIDPRGVERRLQVTGHDDAHTVVLSIWRENACTATFQLPVEETPRLIAHLADYLTASMPVSPIGRDGAPRTVPRLVHRVRGAIARFDFRFQRRQR